MRKDGGEREKERETSLSKKRDSLGRRLHLRRSLKDRKVDQEDAAAGEGPHAGKGGEGDGGGEEEELCVCVCGWVGWRGGGWVRFFFGSAAEVSRPHHHRGFPLAPSHSPGYFQHACQRRPATAHPGTRRTRSGRGRPGGYGCGEYVRENESERAERHAAGRRAFFVCAPFSTHGEARYDGPCRQSRLMLAKQQVSRLHSAGETDVFGPEVCARERESV
jgi:hypothetical protein